MDIMEAIHRRRATRDFTAQPVARDQIRALIEAATWAPSAMNHQPWSFVVVSGRERLARWSERAKARMVATLASHPLEGVHAAHLSSPDFNIFYNAPTLIVICAREAEAWGVQDCCLAAENLMLADCAAGLGTCWIGFAEAWLHHPEGRAELGVGAGYVPVAPIILGHPAAEPAPHPRQAPPISWIEE